MKHLVGVGNEMGEYDFINRNYITVSGIFRGDVTLLEAELQMSTLPHDIFVDWIPNNVLTTVCTVPNQNNRLSLSSIANATAISPILHRVIGEFDKLYSKKSFIHWYIGEGMDEMEFEMARESVTKLITNYEQFDKNNIQETD